MRHQGTITRWDDEKGFGFVTRPGESSSVFVHIKAFENRSRRPKDGDAVTYELSKDRSGRQRADTVRFAGEGARAKRSSSRGRDSKIPVVFTLVFAAAVTAAVLLGALSQIVGLVYLVASVVAFLAYGWDKLAAKQGRWRTAEATLLLLGLACGWPGAVAAQRLLRHKSRKVEFLRAFWVTVVLNVAMLGYIVWSGDEGFLVRLLREALQQ